MSERPPPDGLSVSPEQAARFAEAAEEVRLRLPSALRSETDGIGTLREKRLHAALKRYLSPDPSCWERPVCGGRTDAPDGRRCPVADILTPEGIVEIQTGGFFPLREKLAWYLARTEYRVTVAHPIHAVRYLSWVSPESGAVSARRRSPKRRGVRDVAGELYWLRDFIGDPRFALRLLLLETEEYRLADGWSADGKRGSHRLDCLPVSLLGDVTLRGASDYAAFFIPASLIPPAGAEARPFTAAVYARETGIRGRAVYAVLRLLASLGALAEAGQAGRSRTYAVTGRGGERPPPPRSAPPDRGTAEDAGSRSGSS